MAIALRTVSINPAFLREIKDDHHELRQLIHHTSAVLERPGPLEVEYARLVEMLTKLRDQLAMHFSLEEAYGYYEDAIVAAPHLSRRAEALRGQHFDLFAEMCRLVEAAEELLYQKKPDNYLERVSANYRGFLVRFREHEAAESELILAAFNEDLGTGD
jgi:hypothetical protein